MASEPSAPRANSVIGTSSTAPSSGPQTVPMPPISANMAIWIENCSENIDSGSMKVRYMAWKVPTMAESAAETATAISRTLTVPTPAAFAALSRSRVATR